MGPYGKDAMNLELPANTEEMTPELRLLLACARTTTTEEAEATIRRILADGIDWTSFVKKAIEHGLAGLGAYTLSRVAPDLVPGDLLEAFQTIIGDGRRKNAVLFDELSRLIDGLRSGGVEAIPLKGPILAIQAYGDVGLRSFGDLDFLIRDTDLTPAIERLNGMGYVREGPLTTDQFDLIHRLQGEEVLTKQVVGTVIEPHTRLTPAKMALDIDYAGLWNRARPSSLNGRKMLTLAPEDDAILLAIHGGKEMWWNIKWACDVAAFIASHPALDWPAIAERARAQGCLRMVLLGTALARRYFDAPVPPAFVKLEKDDPIIAQMVQRIVTYWTADEQVGPASYKRLSLDRLRLHDGAARRARYVMRTLFLPAPHHIALVPLPGRLSFAYVPIKLAHDAMALPLWQAYRAAGDQVGRLRDLVAGSDLALALTSATPTVKRHLKARAAANKVLAKDPNDAKAWSQLGHALAGLGRHEEAIGSYRRAIALAPDHAAGWRDCGALMFDSGQRKESIPFIDQALALDPEDSRAWAVRARTLSESVRFAEAVEASDRALALDENNIAAARVGIHSRLYGCDWRERDEDKARVAAGLRAGLQIVTPLDHRTLSNSEAESLEVAQIWSRGLSPTPRPLWRGERYRHNKIRVAYVSADYREHVVAHAIAGCLENHDRARFETVAVSIGPDDGNKMRGRIEAAVDRFVDATGMSDAKVAAMLREQEIDIAIDLNGYSGGRRMAIFAQRPAPSQVSFLGYPGTLGVSFMDYIIADRIVIPHENRVHYREKVVDLPDTYLPAEGRRSIEKKRASRAEVGLPETGFVFCQPNASNELGPEMFDVWMAVLRAVESSVLWLGALNPSAIVALRREAQARGVAPERLVFAPRLPDREDQLARLRLADLFLDTFPFSAHGTLSDALWVALPIVAFAGNTFSSRIAASLLTAIGTPELVTATLAEYESLAKTLAQDPARLAEVKAKLLRNRDVAPLFDTVRYTRYLESAYTTMHERQQAGLSPTNFAVAP